MSRDRPEYPVGTAEDIAGMIADFVPIIHHRLLEPAGSAPDFPRGTLEGDNAYNQPKMLPYPTENPWT